MPTRMMSRLESGLERLLERVRGREQMVVLRNEHVPLGRGATPLCVGQQCFDKRYELTWEDTGAWQAWKDDRLDDYLVDTLDMPGARNRRGEAYRDWCDNERYLEIAGDVMEACGTQGEVLANTLNDAIMNVAEHAFRPWVRKRRISVHVWAIRDGEDIVPYASVAAHGRFGLKPWNPQYEEHELSLVTSNLPREERQNYRGWGLKIAMGQLRKLVYLGGAQPTLLLTA